MIAPSPQTSPSEAATPINESVSGRRSPAGPYLLSGLIAAAALAAPFLLVDVPPVTDLPQLSAQVHLLFEVLGGTADDAYRLQPFDPNKLGYLPLLLGCSFLAPMAAARLSLVLIGLCWLAAIHQVARAAGRPPAAALFAGLFFFNQTLYWGFLNFLCGLPLFCLLWLSLRRLPQRKTSTGALLGLGALFLLLYTAHVLWLALAFAYCGVAALANRWTPRDTLLRLATALPAWILIALWYPRLNAAGFVSQTTWGLLPWERLHPGWLLSAIFGGVRGDGEATLALALVLCAVLGLVQHRKERHLGVEPSLLWPAALFLAASFLLPAVFQNTILFASRWMPAAVVFLALALPAPSLGRLPQVVLPLLFWAGLSSMTTAAWLGFERDELRGLPAALEAVEPGERILGLDFVRTSQYLHGYPFYHLYAWSQPLAGCPLARSFANEGSSLVVFDDLPRTFPWTEGLDWQARKIRRSDIPHFRQVLIHGDAQTQALFEQDPRLEPVTPPNRWRLFRVRENPTPGYTLERPSSESSTGPPSGP